jgi:hypothetical protein
MVLLRFSLILGAILVGLAIQSAPLKAATPMKRVYLLTGDKPPERPTKVPAESQVRIQATGIAGSEITANVTGPAKVEQTHIIPLVNGEPTIGGYQSEFLVTPTGKGKVTVAVTVTYPTGNEPDKANYTIEFE